MTKQKIQNTLNAHTIQSLAREVQESITDVLVKKTLLAATGHVAKSILLSGGVSANLKLRGKFISTIEDKNLPIIFSAPHISLCTDNAAYIGCYAYFKGTAVDWHDVTAIPDLSVEL